MKYTDKLIFEHKAFDFANTKELFNLAMLENFKHHYENSELFRKLCDYSGIKPDDIDDYKKIPYVFVTVLKTYKFITGDEKNVKITLSSSGTGGKKTYIYLDETSLKRITHIVREIFKDYGMVNDEKTNYICFTYDPEVAGDVGTAFSDKMLTGLTDVKEVYYTMKYDETIKDFKLNVEETIEKLLEFSKDNVPVRILGFPAHLYFTLSAYYEKNKKKIKLPENSYIITGGGWKNHTGKEIPKPEFKKILADMLGIPVKNIRDLFGMVEHGIPYVDCEYGHLHVPIYSRAHVFDPLTYEIKDYDEEGLLTLFTPYINSYPSISLLTTDKAVVKNDCPCGRGPYIDLKGRAGKVKHKGCAIVALDKLKKQIS